MLFDEAYIQNLLDLARGGHMGEAAVAEVMAHEIRRLQERERELLNRNNITLEERRTVENTARTWKRIAGSRLEFIEQVASILDPDGQCESDSEVTLRLCELVADAARDKR